MPIPPYIVRYYRSQGLEVPPEVAAQYEDTEETTPIQIPSIPEKPQPDYSGFIESTPVGQFYNFLGKMQRPMRRFYNSRFNDLYNQYQGTLVGDAESGRAPSRKWGDFLSNFNFRQDYMGYSPYQRGSNPSIRAPRTRYLNY